VESTKRTSVKISLEKQEKQEKPKRKKRKLEVNEMSQEKRLKEAKKTEELNLASLKDILKLELEKKRKARQTGPKIDLQRSSVTFISTLKPLQSVITVKEQLRKNAEQPDEKIQIPQVDAKDLDPKNVLIFYSMDKLPPSIESPKQFYPKKLKCVITDLPAKYIDPVTKKPYANMQAFKELRKQNQKQK